MAYRVLTRIFVFPLNLKSGINSEVQYPCLVSSIQDQNCIQFDCQVEKFDLYILP